MLNNSNSQSQICSLAQATAGERVQIISLNCGESNNRLMGMGLMPGVVLEVINCMKNGAVAIALQDNRLGLGADMAERIQVRASKSASSPDREDISTVQKTTMLPRPSVTTLKLQDAAIGSTLRVVSYEPTGREYKRKLLAMGLTPGTEVVVKRHAPLGDPIEVEVRGFRLSLRKDEAAALILESIEGVGS